MKNLTLIESHRFSLTKGGALTSMRGGFMEGACKQATAKFSFSFRTWKFNSRRVGIHLRWLLWYDRRTSAMTNFMYELFRFLRDGCKTLRWAIQLTLDSAFIRSNPILHVLLINNCSRNERFTLTYFTMKISGSEKFCWYHIGWNFWGLILLI